MNRFNSWISIAFLLLGIQFAASVGISAEPSHDQRKIEELVKQLGAATFATRELATNELLAIGTPALPAVQAGAVSQDREVRYRSRLILQQLSLQNREETIQHFVNGTLDNNTQMLPGWHEFSSIAGDAEKSRILFGNMLRHEWQLLDTAFRGDSLAVGEMISNRLIQLERRYRGNQTSIPEGSFAACLFVAGNKDVFLREPIRVFRLCERTEVRTSLVRSENRESMRRFLGRIIAKRLDSITVAQQLLFSCLYEIPEGLEVARQQLSDPTSRSYDRQNSILLIAKLGTAADIPLLETALDDDSVPFRVQKVQIREIALAALIHLSGEDHKAFGFDNLRRDSTWVFQSISLAMTKEKRTAATAKWRSRKNTIAASP